LDGIAQIVGSLGTPVLYPESVLADLIAEDEEYECGDLLEC